MKLCDVYPELFTEGLGKFLCVDGEMRIKPGHENSLGGVRPAAKVPYGIVDEVEAELDKLYETAIPIDPRELDVTSQVVPVVNTKNGKPLIVGNRNIISPAAAAAAAMEAVRWQPLLPNYVSIIVTILTY